MAQDGHGDDLAAADQANAAHPGRGAAEKDPDLGDREADAFATGAGEQHVVVFGAGAHVDQAAVRLLDLHGDLAVGHDVSEIGQPVASHAAPRGGEHDVHLAPGGLVLGQRHGGRDGFAVAQRQQVDQRLAARLRRTEGQAVDLELVDHAARGKEQHRRVRVAHEDLADEVLITGRHAGASLAAAALGAVGAERNPLDVAAVADRDHHVLALDQVLVVVLEPAFLDGRAARGGEALFHLDELAAQDRHEPLPGVQDLQIVLDLERQLLQLADDLLALEAGQALQAQLQDRPRLGLGQAAGAVLGDHPAGFVDQFHERCHVFGRPVACEQRLARRGRVGRAAYERDHQVDVGDRDGEADQDVRPVARLAELEDRAPGDDLLAEDDEGRDDLLEIEGLGPAAVDRHHVDAEGGLQRGIAVQLVEYDLGLDVAAQLDDHAQAVPVALVAQVADALDGLLAHDLGNALDHARLVHEIGDLGDDDGLPVLAEFLDMGLAADA